jgi:histidine ammonia-lyase/phenylalanine ammonia-lyase
MTTILCDAGAIALIALCQAVDLRGGGGGLGKGNRAVYEAIRRDAPFLDEDRPLDGDIRKVAASIRERSILLPEL